MDQAVKDGLLSVPRNLPSFLAYDSRGLDLFEESCRVQEYYQTDSEECAIRRHIKHITSGPGARVLVDLASGRGERTFSLLEVLEKSTFPVSLIAIDINIEALSALQTGARTTNPPLHSIAICGDLSKPFSLRLKSGPALVTCLGFTIGNLIRSERRTLLQSISKCFDNQDLVIISVDLLKDRKRLVRSYDDSAGVTAAFNKNILRVLNARYGANFNLDLFSHVVRWDESRRSIELFLRSAVAQKVRIAKLQLEISLSSGEEIRTLVAEKFVRRDFEDELREGDLCPVGWFTDYDRQIALSVSRPS